MIEVKDRLPLHPGRVKMKPVSGQADTFDMTRADSPAEVGDPLCRNTFRHVQADITSGINATAAPLKPGDIVDIADSGAIVSPTAKGGMFFRLSEVGDWTPGDISEGKYKMVTLGTEEDGTYCIGVNDRSEYGANGEKPTVCLLRYDKFGTLETLSSVKIEGYSANLAGKDATHFYAVGHIGNKLCVSFIERVANNLVLKGTDTSYDYGSSPYWGRGMRCKGDYFYCQRTCTNNNTSVRSFLANWNTCKVTFGMSVTISNYDSGQYHKFFDFVGSTHLLVGHTDYIITNPVDAFLLKYNGLNLTLVWSKPTDPYRPNGIESTFSRNGVLYACNCGSVWRLAVDTAATGSVTATCVVGTGWVGSPRSAAVYDEVADRLYVVGQDAATYEVLAWTVDMKTMAHKLARLYAENSKTISPCVVSASSDTLAVWTSDRKALMLPLSITDGGVDAIAVPTAGDAIVVQGGAPGDAIEVARSGMVKAVGIKEGSLFNSPGVSAVYAAPDWIHVFEKYDKRVTHMRVLWVEDGRKFVNLGFTPSAVMRVTSSSVDAVLVNGVLSSSSEWILPGGFVSGGSKGGSADFIVFR